MKSTSKKLAYIEGSGSIALNTALFILGLNFLWEAVQKLKIHQGAIFNVSAMVIFFISVITKEAMAQFSFWACRKTRLHSLKADGWHHRSDAIASAIILVS